MTNIYPSAVRVVGLVTAAFLCGASLTTASTQASGMPVQQGDVFYSSTKSIQSGHQQQILSTPTIDFKSITPNALIVTWSATGVTAKRLDDAFAVQANFTTPTGVVTESIELDEDVHAKDASAADLFSTSVIFLPVGTTAFSLQLTTDPNVSVSDVRYVSLDSTTPSRRLATGRTAADLPTSTAPKTITRFSNVPVVSRKEWLGKANRSERRSPGWTSEPTRVKSIIIHHTASPIAAGADYTAMVRAIWYYHTHVLGWGDIGYNFIIAPDGTIYIGRNAAGLYKSATSALGPVGGHSYNSSKRVNYNLQTAGIAMLGCYSPEGCGENVTPLTPESEVALSTLLKGLSRRYHITPTSRVKQQDITVPAIAGHINYDYTLCAGEYVMDALPGLRKALAKVLAS